MRYVASDLDLHCICTTKKSLCLIHGLKPSDTEHGWTHDSNTVYSVIHGLAGTSIEPQPCLGMSWYDLDSNVARVCTNKARIYLYSIKQGLHGLKTICKTIFIRLLYGFPSTVCYGLVRLNTTFTRLTGHLQGLVYIRSHRLLFEFDSIRFIYDIDTVELTRGVDFMCGCI